jgi:uncharacterized protein (DUF983 family)
VTFPTVWFPVLDLSTECPNCTEGHLELGYFERQSYTQPCGLRCARCQHNQPAVMDPDGRVHLP